MTGLTGRSTADQLAAKATVPWSTAHEEHEALEGYDRGVDPAVSGMDAGEPVPKPREHLHSLRRTRAFLESLILQYPYHRNAPRATCALDFYSSLFCVWIREIQLEMARLASGSDEIGEGGQGDDQDPSFYLAITLQTPEFRALIFRKVQELASRMDSVIVAVPHNRVADLLELRGMVELWMLDLKTGRLMGENSETNEHGIMLERQQADDTLDLTFANSDDDEEQASLRSMHEARAARFFRDAAKQSRSAVS